MPVFNGEQFVVEAIESVLAQDLGDFEFVISDNGSSDGTEDICRAYASKDARIRYYREDENRGAAWNYNRVFELSSAPYFKWMAHDDVCAPSMLRRCVEALDAAGPDVVLAYPRTNLIDCDGGLIEVYEDHLDLRQTKPLARLLHVVRHLRLVNVLHGVLRREALEKTRLIDAFQGSDVVLLSELSLLGQFREVSEPLFFRRRHPGASRIANRSASDVMRWFDPRRGRPMIPVKVRLTWEHLVSIGRAPLSPGQKAAGWVLYLVTHYVRRLRARAGRIKARILSRAPGPSSP